MSGRSSNCVNRRTLGGLAVLAALLLLTPVQAVVEMEKADRVVVRKSDRELELLRDGEVLRTFPIALGQMPEGHKVQEGDQRTPEGNYMLDARNPNSNFFLSIRVSYPGPADSAHARSLGVDPGGQIMIHGQPNVPKYSEAFYQRNDWTDGCIALSNSDMIDVWLMTDVDTPILILP